MRVFGWSASTTDGCYAYRQRLPLLELRRRGHQTAFGTSWVDEQPGATPRTGWATPDVVLGQRIAMSKPSQLWQAWSRRADRPNLVYELDDDFWSLDATNPAADFFKLPTTLKNIEANIRAADRVIVSTQPLAEVVLGVDPGADVRIVPNCVPEWLTRWTTPTISAPSVASKLVVGWAGSATHAMDWAEVAYQVDRFVRRRNDVELHMIGMNYALGEARFTPWSTKIEDYWKSVDFDIGLAPLRDHAFNRSKSDLKILEYSALGIPTIGSAVGPYRDVPPAFLVSREHQWGAALRLLVEDPAARLFAGGRARDWARTRTIEGYGGALWERALTTGWGER